MYRVETVGSLLRPGYLAQAREALERGALSPAAFKQAEDRAVDQAIALQEGIGLDVVTDGEQRRMSFFDHWLTQLEGVEEAPGVEHTFHGARPEDEVRFRVPVSVTEKVRRKRMVSVEEFVYARSVARRPVKVTLPSPLLLFNLWSPEHSREAYPDPFDLFQEGLRLLREEIEELAALGCTYVQVDAPDLGTLADPEHGQARILQEELGLPLERLLGEGVDLVDAVASGIPGVTFGLHLCKGNFASRWLAAGGYETIAEHVFKRATNYDVFLLEYDDERSGGFEPLQHVPDDKVVVLGLVSSKTSELEPAAEIVRRIDEAARYFPRDQLALSAQCGFASVANGNAIGEDMQATKLALVAEVAHQVWG